MDPTRKPRRLNRRYKKYARISLEKDVGNSDKCQPQKRQLSDALGSRWTKDELQHFYKAYRKYGKDWNKVAGEVHNRTSAMVEALYDLNRAYLLLPDGTASVAGLIAMMTDHYNVQDGSGSDPESNDAAKLHSKPKKRRRGEVPLSSIKVDVLQSPPAPPIDGCLSSLRLCSDGFTVQKRTPRVAVTYSSRKDSSNNILSANRGLKSEKHENVAHVAALALTEASKSGSFRPISQTPYRNSHAKSSPLRSKEKMPELFGSRHRGKSVGKEDCEGRFGSRGAGSGIHARQQCTSINDQTGGIVGICQKRRKINGKEKIENIRTEKFDDCLGICNSTEEGPCINSVGEKYDSEIMKETSDQSSLGKRKRNKKRVVGGNSSELEALQMLADLSLLMQSSKVESELSTALNDGSSTDIADSPTVLQADSTSRQGSKSNILCSREKVLHTLSGTNTCESKNNEFGRESGAGFKASLSEGKQQAQCISKSGRAKPKSSSLKVFTEEEILVNELRHASQISAPSKQSKSIEEAKFSSSDMIRGPDSTVSAALSPISGDAGLPAKPRSRRKRKPKILATWKDMKSHKFISNHRLDKLSTFQDGSPYLKDKVSCCLSSYMARNWCTFEWFYSAIDYPWFAKKEFTEYLNHVGLGYIPRLTRVEWGVIKSSLGKARRFSENFLHKEREKLNQYRESVRKHYTELRAGVKEGLPTDLARPLFAGQHVIAIHPKSREVHDGIVLTVDHDKCRIQFDRPELGVEIVMDIDCMSSDPMDNIPEAIRREHNTADGYFVNSRWLRPGQTAVGRSMEHAPIVQSTNGTFLRQEKVSSVLLNWRQHNTSVLNSLTPWLKSPASLHGSVVPLKSLDTSVNDQESGSRLLGIVGDSKLEARAMVNTAIKAMSKQKVGKTALENVREALYSLDRFNSPPSSIIGSSELDNGDLADSQMKLKSDLSLNGHEYDSTLHNESDGVEAQIPTELITSCVATCLMLQTCSDRQCPPADVAQILDSAVTSLYPRFSQNLPIYREIEMYMGRVKTQILSLVPT